MAELLKEYKDIILSYHEHDSLLENIVDEDLTEEEKKQAWSDYENEKNHPPSSLASRSKTSKQLFHLFLDFSCTFLTKVYSIIHFGL